jgi:hypothetical protein
MRHPRLNLGLLGFNAEQRACVQVYLAAHEAAAESGALDDEAQALTIYPVWQITDFREANGLLLNTHLARIDGENVLRFHVDPLHPDVVGVRPAELAVPYAVCGELAKKIQDATVVQVPIVEVDDQRSVVQALLHFEAMLRPLRTLYALSHELLERRDEMNNKHTYHLMRNGVLDVIVDVPQRRVMVRDGLRPVDLADAAWQSRPVSANSLPHGFSVWMMEEVAWIHALHCHTFNLPRRYRHMPLRLRRTPRVRASLIYPRHAELLEALGNEAHTFDALTELFPDREAHIERDVYALYACRAITTNADGATDHPPSSQGPHSQQGVGSRIDFHLQTAPAYLS